MAKPNRIASTLLLQKNNLLIPALRKNHRITLENATTKPNEYETKVVDDVAEDYSFFELDNDKMDNRSANLRERRSTASKTPSVIETAVFIDQALYDQMRRTFPTDTDRQMTTFVMTMMNAVC